MKNNYPCQAPGCAGRASTRFGRYCRSHVAQLRRHGAIGQTGITKAELKVYRQIVKARLEKNESSALWNALEARWKSLVSIAEGIIALWRSGKPHVRYQREAALEVLRLHNGASRKDLIETVLAMYVYQDQEPRRFKTDAAFTTQLVRRVRGLTALNADSWTDAKTGKKKHVYRDLAPKTVAIMGKWLAEALGAAGVYFSKLERRDDERKQRELIAYHQALDNLQ